MASVISSIEHHEVFLVNLHFTYRWLLLECKREFPFNDALRVLEVMWATLPIDSEAPQLSDLPLKTSPSDTMISDILYTEQSQLAKRRASSCPQLSMTVESNGRKLKHRSSSLTYGNTEQSLDFIQKLESLRDYLPSVDHDGSSLYSIDSKNASSIRTREKSVENSFSLSEICDFDLDDLSACANVNSSTTTASSAQPSYSSIGWLQRLPPGNTMWLEEDNPFLLFLCISLLLAHRNYLLKQTSLDEQEISMHFDRYRRRHHSERILACTRTLYAQYIQWARKNRVVDDLNRFSAS